MIIKSVDQATQLPAGRLALIALNMGFWIECSFSLENVAEAANLIIQNDDETNFVTQAGLVAHAGNNYGWGLGAEAGGEKVYMTM